VDGTERLEEPSLRRRFTVRHTNEYALSARVRLAAETTDVVADGLLNGPVRAHATQRFRGDVVGTGMHVIDGNLDTAWRVDPAEAGRVEIELPPAPVDTVTVIYGTPDINTRSAPRAVAIELTNESGGISTYEAALIPEFCDDGRCVASVPLGATTVSRASLEVLEYDLGVGQDGAPLAAEVYEIRLLGGGIDRARAVIRSGERTCQPWIELDGRRVDVRPAVAPLTPFDLANGITLELCEPLTLTAGSHHLATSPALDGAVLDILLTPSNWPDDAVTELPVAMAEDRDGSIDAEIPSGTDAILRTTIPAHRGWRLMGDGLAVGATLTLDGAQAWYVEAPATAATAQIRFLPERIYQVAWCVTAAFLTYCVWLVRPRRRPHWWPGTRPVAAAEAPT
jgi:hypothetical protein